MSWLGGAPWDQSRAHNERAEQEEGEPPRERRLFATRTFGAGCHGDGGAATTRRHSSGPSRAEMGWGRSPTFRAGDVRDRAIRDPEAAVGRFRPRSSGRWIIVFG